MRASRDFIFCAVLSLLIAFSSHAECPNPSVEELQIQLHRGSAEFIGQLKRPNVAPALGCDRPFIYRGEAYSVDSPQAQDASVLRGFVRDVPEADAYLQSYQDRRDRSRISAYTGTIGILMLIVANTFMKRLDPAEYPIRSVFQIGGLGLTAGGFIYSFSLLRTNESLIPKSVEAWNAAKPADPIELKFQTGWSF
jgi:hypothetical protein